MRSKPAMAFVLLFASACGESPTQSSASTGGSGGSGGAGGSAASSSGGAGGTGGAGGSSTGSGGGGSTFCGGGPDIHNLTSAGDGNGAAVTAFPACIGFASDAYDSDLGIVWLTQGATHEYREDGGWNGGGAARFTPPSPVQGSTGLGQFHLQTGTPPTHLSMRWLMKAGPTMGEYAFGNKTVIFVQTVNDATHMRPMIITRPDPAHPNAFVPAPCDGTVCQYLVAPGSEPWWPDGSDTFWIGDGGYEDQWVSWEFEVDLSEGWIRLYLTTPDGLFNDTLYVQNDFIGGSETGGTFDYIDILGGYFGDDIVVDSGNWFELDEIVIHDQHIGPPEGFVRR